MHYPGKFSNDNKDHDEIFKDKVVLNQAAGNIEFVNTKDAESISITHKNGSFDKLDKNGKDSLVTRDKREVIMGDSLLNIGGTHLEIIDENKEEITLGDIIEKVGDIDKWQKPMEDIKRSQRELHDIKRRFEVKRTKEYNSIDQAPGQSKAGSNARYNGISSKVIKTSSPTKVSTKKKNSGEIIDIKDGSDSYSTVSSSGDRCLTCWGKLLSPSTQDGQFSIDTTKDTIVKKREEIQKKIYEYEKELGQNKHPEGGSYIRTIAKNFIDNIGLVFNDFESFRKDPKGKLVPYGVKIDPLGTTIYTQYRETSLIENVDVEKFPGGSYELNICDGWNVTVGSNGINFKTTGPLNIYGTLVNLVGEQITINARGETSIGGERVDISGEVISLRPKKSSRQLDTGGSTEEEQQVLIDGNLNVALNAIIRGGAHVEGELTVQHITAPCEYQMTETNFTWGEAVEPMKLPNPNPELCAFGINGVKNIINPTECGSEPPKSPTYATLLGGAYIGKAVGYDSQGNIHCLDVYSEESPNFAIVDPHVHPFKTIASKLIEKNVKVDNTAGSIKGSGSVNPHDAIRAIGSRNNWTSPVMAQPVKNSKTPYTVVEKFGGLCESIQINKTDWDGASSTEDTRPSGEGVRTSKYTDSDIKQRVTNIERQLESRYKELLIALADITSMKEQLGNIT